MARLNFSLQVSEILDSELLGEGLIPTLQHAHDMLLVENPVTIPYKATAYGQVTEEIFYFLLFVLLYPLLWLFFLTEFFYLQIFIFLSDFVGRLSCHSPFLHLTVGRKYILVEVS